MNSCCASYPDMPQIWLELTRQCCGALDVADIVGFPIHVCILCVPRIIYCLYVAMREQHTLRKYQMYVGVLLHRSDRARQYTCCFLNQGVINVRIVHV